MTIEGPATEHGLAGRVRAAVLIAALAGAGGSCGLMLRVGRRNSSLLLLALFGIWVLAPFVSLAWAVLASKRWLVRARTALYGVTLLVTLLSLAIYGDVAFGRPRAKPAFIFLVVPLASWLSIAVCAGFIKADPSRRSQDSPVTKK